jgi:magnesium-transporting ATPase (P-type)
MKGFFLSLLGMLLISIFDSFVSYVYHTEERKKTNLITIVVINIMYLNMMVPQAMEQVRVAVSTGLSLSFPEEIKCNNQLVIDILGSVTRIVTDKTGTLTENVMDPILAMIHDEKTGENIFVEKESREKMNDAILNCLKGIYSTTGIEPEEISIRKMMESYAELLQFEPPDPHEVTPGKITFKTKNDGKTHQLNILINFGFWRSLISKSCLFEMNNQYFIGVQAGGDEFWTNEMIENVNKSCLKKIEIWNNRVSEIKSINGAIRSWSHGFKEISKKEAENIIQSWRESIKLKENKESCQKEIVLNSLNGIKLYSKTLMVDKYRDGVIEGFHKLYSSGKQIFICTGDSIASGFIIAKQFKLPLNREIIKGNDKKEIIESLHSVKSESSTLFFNQEIMNQLVKIEKEFGFEDEIFHLIFSILNAKDDTGRYKNYAFFCRATPALKPWVVRMMQYKPKHSLWEKFFYQRNYVLAMGDGANDLNMIDISDVSLGIQSGETTDIISKASFWSNDWKPVVDLLLKQGPEKSVLISLMVKLVFLKHWMTAFTLWSDLIYNGFVLLPFDPMNPMLMLIFNALVFTQIVCYSSTEEVKKANTSTKLMGTRSLLRWVIGAGITGFAIDGLVRLFFPNADSNEFGSMILVGQAISLGTYLILITNTFKNKIDQNLTADLWFNLFSILTSGMVIILMIKYLESSIMVNSLILMIFVSIFYSSLSFLKLINAHVVNSVKYFIQCVKETPADLIRNLVFWTHSWNGRIIPSLLFICIVSLYSGTSFLSLLLIGFLVSLITWMIFVMIISKKGFLNSLFEGKVISVAIVSFMLGYFVRGNVNK